MNDETAKMASVPLPLDTKARLPPHRAGAGERESAAAPLLFRGLPICWEVSQQTRRAVEKNAFGPDTITERPGRKTNLIVYNGQTYQKESFYKAVF